MVSVHVATLNIRNVADRWDERLPLLLADMAALQPDVLGLFNAEPDEPTYARMQDAGFRSAHVEANAAEPAMTWRSGFDAPARDVDGQPRCLDYVWVRGAIEVESCGHVFDRPAVGDPTLYPSDHLGLSARITVG